MYTHAVRHTVPILYVLVESFVKTPVLRLPFKFWSVLMPFVMTFVFFLFRSQLATLNGLRFAPWTLEDSALSFPNLLYLANKIYAVRLC
jgi:hypothetical protein